MKFYHNARCRKSREGKQLLEEKNIEFQTIEYLKEPLDKKEIKRILNKSSQPLEHFLRKTEADFKSNFKGIELSIDKAADLLSQYPKVLQRPLLETKDDVIVGRPPENFLEVI